MKIVKLAFIFLLAVFAAMPAFSEKVSEREKFDVKVGGIKIGFLGYVAKNDGVSYSISFGVRSTGLLDVFRKVEIDARASGRVFGDDIVPENSSVNSIIGDKVEHYVLKYNNGVPQIIEMEPPLDESAPQLDPKEQAGALDPLSALYQMFRHSKKDKLCDKEFFLYDGERRAKISMGKPVWENGMAKCECHYIRIAGYSESELKERKDFPFTLNFELVPGSSDTYHLALLEGISKFGGIRIEKR